MIFYWLMAIFTFVLFKSNEDLKEDIQGFSGSFGAVMMALLWPITLALFVNDAFKNDDDETNS
jgi:uncharacterized membrane-anchored protein